MRILKYSLILSTIGFLTGCVHHTEDYAQKAQVVPPLHMPPGVNLKTEQNYYPLPRTPNVNTPPPSVAPPGTDYERYKKTEAEPINLKPQQLPQQFSMVKWNETQAGPTISLAEKPDLAWVRVGKALRATDYQVLDQDPTMSSYYILDTKATKEQVTEKTPIYRVYVKKDVNDNSTIELLSDNNNLVHAEVAKRVLKALQQHLV